MHIRVHVHAGARKEEIKEVKDGVLAIRVQEPAEGNRANTRVRELVAERLTLRVAQVRIYSGHHSPSKLLSIDNTPES